MTIKDANHWLKENNLTDYHFKSSLKGFLGNPENTFALTEEIDGIERTAMATPFLGELIEAVAYNKQIPRPWDGMTPQVNN